MTREEAQSVIGRVLAGDTDAFEILVRTNQRKVYNLCLRMTGSQEDAEDLAQEAFLRAYQNLASYKGESAFSAWLYRLTSNVCIDHLRRERKRDKGSLTYLDEAGTVQEIEVPDERFTPEGTLERRQVQESIQKGLDTLTPEHRNILVLREVGGLSYDEIAASLGLSAGTVKSRISRARQSLSKFLLTDGNISVGISSERVSEEKGGV
ncbi:MAG: sigma-70 family RNA polymerase sigma factor [Oscillospiraceae bacterium]|nr:sigma-70 family RNA polymerase sigma factor [Oscillospiraceae bacterium]